MFIFFFRFSELRLIDIPSLKDSLPLTIVDLKKNAYKATQQGVKRLVERWIPTCVKVISDRRDAIEECMPEDEVGIMWEKRRGGSAGGAGRGTVVGRVGPPVPTSLKCCQTYIVNPLLTDVLRFCVTHWVGVVSNCTVWTVFWTLSLFLLVLSRLLRQHSEFFLVSSPTVQLDIKGAFHFPRNSANSG